jgi:hypothetical protein
VGVDLIFLAALAELLVVLALELAAFAVLLGLPKLSDCVLNGRLIMLELLGVGLAVQYQSPLAKAQACPSLAVPYGLVWLIVLPIGSSSQTWPPLLTKLKPVSTEKKAVKPFGASIDPSGKV